MLLVSVSNIEDGWERTVYLPHVSAELGHRIALMSQNRTLTSLTVVISTVTEYTISFLISQIDCSVYPLTTRALL